MRGELELAKARMQFNRVIDGYDVNNLGLALSVGGELCRAVLGDGGWPHWVGNPSSRVLLLERGNAVLCTVFSIKIWGDYPAIAWRYDV